MNELEQGHHTHGSPGSDHAPHDATKRERRGWPFWAGLVLALVALAFYMLSGDQGGWYRGRPPQPVATATAK